MNCLSAKFYSFVYVSLDGVYTESIEDEGPTTWNASPSPLLLRCRKNERHCAFHQFNLNFPGHYYFKIKNLKVLSLPILN